MSKKIQSPGVGESRLNMAPAGTFEKPDIRKCHMGGQLIGEFYDSMTPEQQSLIVYRNTDEGIEARQADLEARGRVDRGPRVEITRSEFDGKVEQYGDLLNERRERVSDPYKQVVEKHTSPGFSGKMMSPAAIKRHGMRGYQVVTGKDGEPISMGDTILGQIPTEVRDARKAYARQLDREQQQRPEKDFREQEEQNFSRAGISLAAARRASAEGSGLQNDSPFD